MSADPSQFYTGLVADAYAPLRGSVAPVEPYLRFVRRHGEPALEIGCGHGEPLLDLVAAGLDVTGLDSSADMLDRCRDEAARQGLSVKLACQRMEEMELNRRFASIYFAGPTFQLVVDKQAAGKALRRIATHLTEHGRVLVPLFTPVPLDAKHLVKWKEHTTADGTVLAVRTLEQQHRPAERRMDTVLEYRRGPAEAPTECITCTWSLRWYEDNEFEDLAADAGLVVDRVRDHGEFGRSLTLRAEVQRSR
jgi:SAM-dependent methyltransferase